MEAEPLESPTYELVNTQCFSQVYLCMSTPPVGLKGEPSQRQMDPHH